jgi:RNA polymerase sigma-B factor
MEESASPLVSYASRHIDAANRLVTSFSYLCGRAARKFLRSGLERCDLEQVAAVGLIKASRRYDAGTRTPFEAYAWLVIVGELMHYVRDYEFGIRIPRALLELEREVAAAQDALAVRLEREPTTAEIADVLGVSAMAVARARRIRSVARPLAVDEVNTLALASGDGLGAEDRFALTQAFRKLGALERRVVGGMYLLGLTQAQIASALEISPKRVSRAHLRALANMRQGWTA